MQSLFDAFLRRFGSKGRPSEPVRPPAPSGPPQSGVALVLGDSLSTENRRPPGRGWVALLAAATGIRIVNDSVGGSTVADGLKRLPDALRKHRPAIVLIALGGNDGMRRTPLDVFGANLSAACQMVKAAGARPVLLQMRTKTGTPAAYDQGFRKAYEIVATEQGALLVRDFLGRLGDDPRLFESDRTHPNTAAQRLLFETVYEQYLKMPNSAR